MSSDLAREERRKTRDWSELNEDLLAEIIRHIVEYKDFASFNQVCRSWKSAGCLENYEARRRSAFLLLLCRRTPRLLYNLTSRRPCDEMNETVHKSFRQSRCGMFTSHGWVVMESINLKLLLLNPVDGTTIHLPDLRCVRCYGSIPSFQLRQAVISSNPSCTSDYTVILKASVFNEGIKCFLWQAGGGNLSGCNHPGWSVFPLVSSFKVASFRGLLATLLFDGSIQVHDPKTQLLTLPTPPYKSPPSPGWCHHNFFLGSQSGLMVIVQWLDSSLRETKEFNVFEFDWVSNEWTEVEDLGCRALFLKIHQSPTLLHGCNRFLANRIYYLSSSSSSLKAMKLNIYNLATKLFEPSLRFPRCRRAQWIFPMKKRDQINQSKLS